MIDLFYTIWNWDIAPFPVLVALLIYFVPIYWRKYKSNVYTPLYFSVYPLAKLNIPLSRYLAQSYIDDYFDDNDAEREKKLLKVKSIYSTIFYVIVLPFFLSIIWSIFLTKEQFYTSVVIVLVSIILRFTSSVIRFDRFTRTSRKGLLSFFYSIVLFVFFYILIRVHLWFLPFYERKDFSMIITTIGDFILMNVIISILLVGILIPIIITIVFDKNVRDTNVEQIKAQQQTATSYYMELKGRDYTEFSSSSDNNR